MLVIADSEAMAVSSPTAQSKLAARRSLVGGSGIELLDIAGGHVPLDGAFQPQFAQTRSAIDSPQIGHSVKASSSMVLQPI